MSDRDVWFTTRGTHYHYKRDCTGLNAPRQTTEAAARRRWLEPCEHCVLETRVFDDTPGGISKLERELQR